MSQSQTIAITQGRRPPLLLNILEQFRVRFYATVHSEVAEGAGWAQATSGRYWRLDVPPAVYQALMVGDTCAVLWHGEEGLGAVDWHGHGETPNATAYQLDPTLPGGHVMEYEGNVTCTGDQRPALMGRVDADPDAEWWLIVPDTGERGASPSPPP